MTHDTLRTAATRHMTPAPAKPKLPHLCRMPLGTCHTHTRHTPTSVVNVFRAHKHKPQTTSCAIIQCSSESEPNLFLVIVIYIFVHLL